MTVRSSGGQSVLSRHNGRPAGDPAKDMRSKVVRTEQQRAASRQRVADAKARVERFLTSTKEATPCADCGGYFPHPAMEFDHVRGEKLFSIANFKRHPTLAMARLEAEIAKCDLVCAICHRVREWNRRHPEDLL